MCGIFGYLGKSDAIKLTLKGIQFLEYRGYDSAGIAGLAAGREEFFCAKEVGKIQSLQQSLHANSPFLHLAIAHTRWATHGRPSIVNAHPHFDAQKKVAIVHNGIIENYRELQAKLGGKGFVSDTDSEVIAHMIAKEYQGDLLTAVEKVVQQIQGAYALAVIHLDHPDEMVVAAFESPLAIGIKNQEFFIASDVHAFAEHTHRVYFLQDRQIARLHSHRLELKDEEGNPVSVAFNDLNISLSRLGKGHYQHFMLKEIFEQPDALRRLLKRAEKAEHSVNFPELDLYRQRLQDVQSITILGCGSSWHAGMAGALLFEELAHVRAEAQIASELRYRKSVLPKESLLIVISQSGETSDTLAAMREMKKNGYLVIGICNVESSSLSRDADVCLYLDCGPEIGVASTKAYTSQLMMLALLGLYLGSVKNALKQDQAREWISHMHALPSLVEETLCRSAYFAGLDALYAASRNFLFLGRQYMFSSCLEGALKLKEISYLHASGYPAGEMKHGPIALIDKECLTVALCAHRPTFDKMMNNIMEVRTRLGKVLAIAFDSSDEVEKSCDVVFRIPATLDALAPILVAVATQRLAYEVARYGGKEIDQPRNLAKSVTVE